MNLVKLSVSTALLCAVWAWSFPVAEVSAGEIYNNWNYAIDSQNDGSGAAEGFEMRGLAFREVNGFNYFAVSSAMPLSGIPWGGTLNGNIGYGDLFLNYSSHNLDTASEFNDPNVFAIRFDRTNDSLGNVGGSNPTLGLFSGISATSLTLQNSGYGSLQQYYDYGFGRSTGAMGDLNNTTDVVNYLGNGTIYPNVSAGTKIGEVSLLNAAALAGLGLDFSHFGADPSGNQIFGFAVNSSLLPHGSFIAHMFYECGNDGMALSGVSAPEPGSLTLIGTGLVSLIGWRRLRRNKRISAN